MELIQILVLVSALLCSLVAGFVFCFSVVVMPGIRTLGDRDFLRSFKVMDGIIQNNPPVFILVWLGSALVLIAAAALGALQLDGPDGDLLIIACGLYIFCVQVPTIAFNIPLNNRLQSLDLDAVAETEIVETAEAFKRRWVRWNTFRTIAATLTVILLLVALTWL
ncbi:DUF1772 domain-containing protein [Pyruvatibacter sp.]|uniref:anthrone oxygenase family protein n=1 Tax=Pyruvatibacter sp. TaxID=1981328 RepID=UPI003267ED69